MLLQKYLQTIEKINPNKIYVENVRGFFKVPTFVAKLMCEMAVVDKVFIKKIALICSNEDCNRVIASYNSANEIPEIITCSICELEDKENYIYETRNLDKIEFYQLNTLKNEQ